MTIFNRAFLALSVLGLVAATQPALAKVPFAKWGNKEAAKVVGTVGRPAMYIYSVEFIRVDNDNIGAREVMWLEPGRYEISVRAGIINPPRLTRSGARLGDDANRIELELEAGKVYFVGLRYNVDNYRSPYATVLYRVEDQE